MQVADHYSDCPMAAKLIGCHGTLVGVIDHREGLAHLPVSFSPVVLCDAGELAGEGDPVAASAFGDEGALVVLQEGGPGGADCLPYLCSSSLIVFDADCFTEDLECEQVSGLG